MRKILGIDVGGTGIKGAIVDVETGHLLTDRIKVLTIQPATPESVVRQVQGLIKTLEYNGDSIGIGFPAVIKSKKTRTAANVDASWIDFPMIHYFEEKLNKKVFGLNDADAAGLAEFTYSDSIPKTGTTVFLTIGTGIGSAVFINGELLPNTEFGHLKFKKDIAEKYVSNRAREVKDLKWSEWGKELNKYLKHLSFVLNPDQFILGGGVSKKLHRYEKYLDLSVPIRSATLLNTAGVIGAAVAADRKMVF